MKELRARIAEKHGDSWARIKLQWLCQKYNVSQWDEVPEAMKNERI